MTIADPAPRTAAAEPVRPSVRRDVAQQREAWDRWVASVPTAPLDDVVERCVPAALERAQRWVDATKGPQAADEKKATERLASLVHDPGGVEMTMHFVDRVARPEDDAVAARALGEMVGDDLPDFLSVPDRVLMAAGARIAPLLPRIAMPLARVRLRQLVGHLVADADDRPLGRHLAKARRDGVQLNLNLLGEAVLGSEEADTRLAAVRRLVEREDVDYVSVKASSVAAQLVPWDPEGSRDRLVERLLPLYRTAAERSPHVFLNLDMEEYKDLHLTIDVFEQLVSTPGLERLEAGIVLQAYLPDALPALERITDFARARVEAGGAPVKVRLVKGANLAMEHVDAQVHDWPQAPYTTKEDVDANYVRLLDVSLTPERTRAVRIGVASHNLPDVALAVEVARARGAEDGLDVEMLQGMAPAQARAVRADAGRLVLYTPVVHAEDFDVAVSYLVRRLEENAAPQNYLYALFAPDSAGGAPLADQEQRFRDSVRRRFEVGAAPQRTQDRLAEEAAAQEGGPGERTTGHAPDQALAFSGEPDTDPSLPANRVWAQQVLAREPGPVRSPVVTDVAEVDAAVERARAAGEAWAAAPVAERAAVLRRAGDLLAARRGDLVAVMAHEAGKTVAEADPEVSEAVDFARYYARSALELEQVEGATFTPARVVVVTPPWNFPVAIPMGGVLAGLAAGAGVVIKPAPQVVRCSEVGLEPIQEALAEAGAPEGLLQLLRTDEADAGRRLVTHPVVDAVVLTGASATARLFRSWRPDLRLLAETSGKNALVVTPSADIDLAVADVVRSAFGHAGQKCSAASLVLAVGSVARSQRFRRQLEDAVRSLPVGVGTDLSTVMGPVIEPPTGDLHRALTTLEPGERWLVEPRQLDDTGRLWSPGVREGVRRGSWFATTECFGPVLGIMEVRDLEEAAQVALETGFGLTGGIHTLDDAEVDAWLEIAPVGNAYVNRHITGAIVERQSFGGWNGSAVGAGAKAGGPNYVAQLGTWADADLPGSAGSTSGGPDVTAEVAAVLAATAPAVGADGAAWLRAAASSDERAWAQEIGVERDATGLEVEENTFRYRPLPSLQVRCGPGTTPRDVARVRLAAARTGTPLVLSAAPGAEDLRAVAAAGAHPAPRVRVVVEDAAALGSRLGAGERLRVLGDLEPEVAAGAAEAGTSLVTGPALAAGRRELLTAVREQAVSRTRHRFGHVQRPSQDQDAAQA
ncbi:bifunctional proline dehydrogenase/L-glutamate gamma-semialdehyde dehydrogenase [uncultured Pseudokineococcus sp.]|uniref:bifunctional proline dehydrogenase/L-glutamate gamma-semialdehyde dehydrogenase n=1 Tax=uncultured Pseudokineococcus sp. TaxID=1642928 RepID=UPI00262692D2|nr:bifunctional proline dehydrogenase/L-glutamate gamma-semialdehyde dehydrogenase [uncultured Pseudokineococcus sp.]